MSLSVNRIIVPTMSIRFNMHWCRQSLIWLGLGLVMGLSGPSTLPGIELGLIAFLGLVPLLAWMHHQASQVDKPLKAALTSTGISVAAFGLGYHLVFGWWLLDVHPMTWLGFALWQSRLLSIGTLLLYVGVATIHWWLWGVALTLLGRLLHHTFMPKFAHLFFALVAATLWLFVWSVYDLNPLGVPWASLTVSLAPYAWWRFWIGILGTPLITWIMVFTQALSLEVLRGQKLPKHWTFQTLNSRRHSPISPVIALIALTLMVLIGSIGIRYQASEKFPLSIGVVQGHLPIHVVRNPSLAEEYAPQAYWQPALQLAKTLPKDSLILLPEEGAIPHWVNTQFPYDNSAINAFKNIANKNNIHIISGGALQDGPRAYNGLIQLSPGQSHVAYYRKRQLVPFGEVVPWIPAVWVSKALQWATIDFNFGFQAGPPHQRPFLLTIGPNKSLKVGGLICFEGIYRYLYVDYQRQQVQFLVTASNLGWFHDNRQMARQFLAIQQQYAAEFHLPIVVATNSGLSAVISSSGRILAQSPSQDAAIIRYNAP